MINDHGPDTFKIIPDWFQNLLRHERGVVSAKWQDQALGGTDRAATMDGTRGSRVPHWGSLVGGPDAPSVARVTSGNRPESLTYSRSISPICVTEPE